MAGDALIGIDVGTTSVKAVLIDGAGRTVAGFAEGYPTRRPGPGRVEQDPEDWLRLILKALDGFAARPEAGAVGAIGFTSQVNTHVFVGLDRRPRAPAIVWQDTRAAAVAARLDAAIGPAERAAWFGGPMPVDASNALARMVWMAEEAPEVWDTTALVMAPKDYCIARLTTEVAADPIASVGLVGPDGGYARGFLDRLEGAAGRLPPLRDPLTALAPVRGGLPFAGVPVVVGTMDAWAGMFGVGAVAEGDAFYLSGTSEVLGRLAAARVPTEGVVVFAPWRGLTLHAAPTQAGGAALDWLARLLGRPPEALAALARGPGPGPLFLPHLEGERAPFWDPAARGAFAGLSGASGAEDLAAAVLEGVALAARLALEAAAASAGGPGADPLRAGGGGMRADAWVQLRADVLGRPLARVAVPQTAALGAAMMAGVATGRFGDLAEAAAALVAVERVFAPDPAAAAAADERLALFRALYGALRPLNPRLA